MSGIILGILQFRRQARTCTAKRMRGTRPRKSGIESAGPAKRKARPARLIAALLLRPGMCFSLTASSPILAAWAAACSSQGACLGNDQHRQAQSVHHTQGVLEIDALAVLELGQHDDGGTAMPGRLVNGRPFRCPASSNAVAQLLNGANRRT